MLKNLTIQGFQCHQNLSLNLKGINVLIGDNGSGKSAALRALRWLALGQWDGNKDDLISWGLEECIVSLTTEKHTIQRERRDKGKDPNVYKLDEEVYKAFGTKIPDAITKAINLTEDNFQNQIDPAFWLTLNSSQAAQALNEIFNLSKIDEVSTNIATDLREARSRAMLCEVRMTEAQKTLRDLEWTEQANKDLCEIESLQESCKQLQQTIEFLGEQLSIWENYLKDQKNSTVLIKAGEEVLSAWEVQKEMDKTWINLQELQLREQQAAQDQEQVKKKEKQLNKYLSGTCPLCGRK